MQTLACACTVRIAMMDFDKKGTSGYADEVHTGT